MFSCFHITSITLEGRNYPCWVSLVGCTVVIAGKMQAEAEIARPVTILAFESLAPQGFSDAVFMWGKDLSMKAVFLDFYGYTHWNQHHYTRTHTKSQSMEENCLWKKHDPMIST